MPDAAIVSYARTPIGKAFRGALNLTHGATLGAHVLRHAVQRAGIDPGEVEDVVLGCAFPEGANGFNVGRISALAAGFPEQVSGMTVNRYCSSGLQSIAIAAQAIQARSLSIAVAGGTESVSCVREHTNRFMREEPWLAENRPEVYMPMIDTADLVARRYGIARSRQDEYSARSQQRYAAALAAGHFDAEIVPLRTTIRARTRTAASAGGGDPGARRRRPARHDAGNAGDPEAGERRRQRHRRQRQPVVRRRRRLRADGCATWRRGAGCPCWAGSAASRPPAARPTRWASGPCSPYRSCCSSAG